VIDASLIALVPTTISPSRGMRSPGFTITIEPKETLSISIIDPSLSVACFGLLFINSSRALRERFFPKLSNASASEKKNITADASPSCPRYNAPRDAITTKNSC